MKKWRRLWWHLKDDFGTFLGCLSLMFIGAGIFICLDYLLRGGW